MHMRLNRMGGLLLAALLASVGSPWGLAVFAADEELPLSDEAITLLTGSRSQEWIVSLEQGISRLRIDQPLPSAAYDTVLGAIGAGSLPEDPLGAARELHAAACVADRARRRGMPAPLLREEIRLAWSASRKSAKDFELRAIPRGESAARGFAADNRRAWDPYQAGRSSPDSGSQGSGAGGHR
jgi:hypothetical protein